jgi:CubicO group peptidase (beta-lactamase class C family)
MKKLKPIIPTLAILSLATTLMAGELPRLPKDLDPKKQTNAEQKKLPDLPEAYVSTAPEDLNDGLKVGKLSLPGTKKAVAALVADDKAGKYDNLDSMLIWHDGKLVFEMYNRRGRVDAPHYTMSITKTLTSITLARAIQCGLLDMDDLDKPVIDFMNEIDRSKIKPGVETITLHDALFMKSGLRITDKKFTRGLGNKYQKQQFFQHLFEETEPVATGEKEYKYSGLDPAMTLMVMDIKTPGTIQEFIEKELAGKFGTAYCWNDQAFGLPGSGAGSNFTSRDLMKFGTTVIQGGKFDGEQLLSAEYIEQVMAPKESEGYYYHFHNRIKTAGGKQVRFVSGIGAGGQYMATFPELNVVAVATAHNTKNIRAPLDAMLDHLIPLFVK